MAPSTLSDGGDGHRPGPHPSYIQTAKPYIFESKIQECVLAAGITEARDDSVRLQAVTWIDSVRRAMHLPVRTYNTAAVYFHKFRLVHPDNSGFIDAAAAALFTACKIEDTLKKSRDILCAAHNLKLSASEQLTPDDPMFENHSKIIIGVERLMLEASGFDFRNRYPQRLLLKIAKLYDVSRTTVGKTAYNMSLDLYRTFAPLKQTTSTMAIACVELAGRIHDQPIVELETGRDYTKWKTTRQEIMETLLDLLDLYTHHRASTVVGQDHALEKFISTRIALNQEASAESSPRYTESNRKKALTNGTTSNGVKEKGTPKELTSPRDVASPKDIKSPQPMGLTSVTGTPVQGKPGLKEGTVRFMLDPERARDEKHIVADFFKMDEEEYEVEVENDRRRDSGISMTPPIKQDILQEEDEDSRILSWVEQMRHDAAAEVKHEGCTDQADCLTAPLNEDRAEPNSFPPKRGPKSPLADQGVAFQAALQQSHSSTSSLRGGQSKKRKENQAKFEDVPPGHGKKGKPALRTMKPRAKNKQQVVGERGQKYQTAPAAHDNRVNYGPPLRQDFNP
ncbi:MAG: hypothetical protein Q9183_003555 [Haloplaca sp. 2 TL-2023]